MSEETLRPEEVAELDPYKRRRKTVVSEAEELLQGPEGEAVTEDEEMQGAEASSPIDRPADIQINPVPNFPQVFPLPKEAKKEYFSKDNKFLTPLPENFKKLNKDDMENLKKIENIKNPL